MDKALKQRLVGATVLIILAVIVLPMLLSGRSDTLNTESRQIELPQKPEELSFETRRFPVGIPAKEAPPVSSSAGYDGGSTMPLQQDPEEGIEVNSNQAEPSAASMIRPPAATTVIINPPETSQKIEPGPADASPGRPRYLVQVASFSSEKRANAMAAELRAGKLSVVMDVVDRTAGRLHRVRVGPYIERSEVDAVIAKIRSMNKDLNPRVVDTRPGDGAPVSAPTDPLVRWVVQTGSYSSADTAESEVVKLRLAGLTAFSEKVTSATGTTYKVRIGPEIDRPRAVQLAKEIKAKYNLDGFVTTQE